MELAIGSGNDYVERITVLSLVVGLFGNDGDTPEGTLVVCNTGRVRAADGIGINTRVTFDVHVESYAAGSLIAERGTFERIEARKGDKTHILWSAQGAVEIRKDIRISIWCWGT